MASQPNIPWLINRGLTWLNDADPEFQAEGVECLKTAFSLTPSVALATRCAEALDDVDLIEAAIEFCQQGLAIDPNDLRLQVLMGSLLMQVEHTGEAFQWFRRALKQSPSLPPALLGIADCYYAQEQWRRAIQWYNRTEKCWQSDEQIASWLYLNRSHCHRELHRTTLALEDANAYITMHPERVHGYIYAIDAFSDREEWQGVIDIIAILETNNIGLEADSYDWAYIYHLKGLALVNQDRLEEALATHQRALEIVKQEPFHRDFETHDYAEYIHDTQHRIALLLLALKRLPEAIAYHATIPVIQTCIHCQEGLCPLLDGE